MRPYGLILRHTYSQVFFVGASPPHPRKAVLDFNFSPFALCARMVLFCGILINRVFFVGAPPPHPRKAVLDFNFSPFALVPRCN